MPPGWNVWGDIEVKEITEVMKLMVEVDERDEIKIFREHPQSMLDNYFSGDQIMNWLGEDGIGATMPCRRDRLLGEIEGK